MALPDVLMARLIQTVKSHDLGGHIATLGRQTFIGSRRGKSAEFLKDMLETHLDGISEDDLRNPDDGFTERFFEMIGFSNVDTIDASDYEKASIVQDMSKTLSTKLRKKFDVVYDGGTCEHVFDIAKAYANIDAMLKPGGVLIGHSPCNNWINHGFYQITPEVVFSYWERAMGYRVLELSLQPTLPNFPFHTATATNPNETGRRPKIIGDLPQNSPIILNYAVQKPMKKRASSKGQVYQGDYVDTWNK